MINTDSSAFAPLSRVALRRDSDASAARMRTLKAYRILDTEAELGFDELAALAAQICSTPMAAISFVCDIRQWFKAEIGIGRRETPLTHSFCARAIVQNDLFVIEDASAHPIFCDNPLVTGAMHVRFYAGMPIRSYNGIAIGTLCVVGQEARPDGLSPDQRRAMSILARQVESQLELRRSINERDRHSDEQQALTQRLNWVANHDQLTRLPNRALFRDRLTEAISHSRTTGKASVVMLVDIDHFKQVNDAQGHDAGDALLCAFAERLHCVIKGNGTVARIGGDEFAVIVPSIADERQIATVTNAILHKLREPFKHNGRSVECRASIGCATFPDHAQTAEELVKNADLALADAKAAGRNIARVFRNELALAFQHETEMLDRARTALAQEQIYPYYQPKLAFETGQIKGFEALLRWQTDDGDIALPAGIASAFDDRELSAAISDRIINQVLRDMHLWAIAGVPFDHVAINTSAADFASNDFAERLLSKLVTFGVSPTQIEIEVTESVVLSPNSQHVHRALAALSEAGMRIALDDFGTGFASLTSLKQLPITALKIDKSFVDGVGTDNEDEAIIGAITALGKKLGIDTIAEGVERWEQASRLAELGATLGQGYLFSRAVPANVVPFLLKRDHSRLFNAVQRIRRSRVIAA